MFKTGEQVVMSDADDYDSIFTVVGQPPHVSVTKVR
jgi:hypothetical protein